MGLTKPGNEVFGAVGEEMIWYNYDTSNKKHWYTLINHLQRICRATLEYDYWQRACKYKDSKDCPVCDENYYDKNLDCESHHHPKTLKIIIEEVVEKHIENNDLDDTSGLEIVDEVMGLHVTGQVHYINLCVHCHKKFHKDHPDVLVKIDEIFEQRAKEGKDLWEADLESVQNKKSIDIDIDKLDKNTVLDYDSQEEISAQLEEDLKDYNSEIVISANIAAIDDLKFKVPKAPLVMETKVKVSDSIEVFNETKTGFEGVSIDIERFE